MGGGKKSGISVAVPKSSRMRLRLIGAYMEERVVCKGARARRGGSGQISGFQGH
jgi:hypothetical protein